MSLTEDLKGRRAARARRARPSGPVMRQLRLAPQEPAAAPFKMQRFRAPRFPDRVFDIRDHGAVPQADCSAAIAAAIAMCAHSGGGRVLIPAGLWLTGPIHLQSNVELHLADGAQVRFSPEPERYLPAVFVRWGGFECFNYSPLIYAHDCSNIAITGRGQLLGGGPSWWGWAKSEARSHARLYEMAVGDVPVARRVMGESLPMRPQMIAPINCTNVLLEGFTVAEGGPLWTVHVAYCRNVIVRGLTINAPDGPNNDGIVIDSSRNVIVEDCTLHTHEDCVSLKSGMNEDGWRVGRPTENVIIRRIRASRGMGGFAIGSDMSGGVRNVRVHDCHFDGVSAGIRFKAARGRGGVVENVRIDNIVMDCIPGDAIQLTSEYESFARPDGRAPVFRDIHIRNVRCAQSHTAARMIGLADSALQNITLQDVTIAADEGLYCFAGNGIQLLDVRITPASGPVFSMKDTQRVVIDGLNPTATSSTFLDLRGRQTRNIRLRGEASNHARPAIVLGIDVPHDALVHE